MGEPGPERLREGQELVRGHTASRGVVAEPDPGLCGVGCRPDGTSPALQTSQTSAQKCPRRCPPTSRRRPSMCAGAPMPAGPAPPSTYPLGRNGWAGMEHGHILFDRRAWSWWPAWKRLLSTTIEPGRDQLEAEGVEFSPQKTSQPMRPPCRDFLLGARSLRVRAGTGGCLLLTMMLTDGNRWR